MTEQEIREMLAGIRTAERIWGGGRRVFTALSTGGAMCIRRRKLLLHQGSPAKEARMEISEQARELTAKVINAYMMAHTDQPVEECDAIIQSALSEAVAGAFGAAESERAKLVTALTDVTDSYEAMAVNDAQERGMEYAGNQAIDSARYDIETSRSLTPADALACLRERDAETWRKGWIAGRDAVAEHIPKSFGVLWRADYPEYCTCRCGWSGSPDDWAAHIRALAPSEPPAKERTDAETNPNQ